jgi:large conductance mechanosensitive channel
MGFIKEFKEFAVKGNVVDMAVGIIIGGAFGTIAKSLVDDLIMPPIGMLLGNVDFSQMYVVLRDGGSGGSYPTLAAAKEAGAVTLNYGLFINNVLSFLIVALAVFFMIRGMNRLRGQAAAEPAPTPTTRACPFCFTEISLKATRCPHCTSQLTS